MCSVSVLEEPCTEDMSPEDSTSDRLSFYRFDISRLLKHGASLLGSAGAEFEVQDDKSGRLCMNIYMIYMLFCLSNVRIQVKAGGLHSVMLF